MQSKQQEQCIYEEHVITNGRIKVMYLYLSRTGVLKFRPNVI